MSLSNVCRIIVTYIFILHIMTIVYLIVCTLLSNFLAFKVESFSIRTAVFIVLLRYGGYFGTKETPFASAASPAETLIGRIAFHLQVHRTFTVGHS